jgi:hypothetical protein
MISHASASNQPNPIPSSMPFFPSPIPQITNNIPAIIIPHNNIPAIIIPHNNNPNPSLSSSPEIHQLQNHNQNLQYQLQQLLSIIGNANPALQHNPLPPPAPAVVPTINPAPLPLTIPLIDLLPSPHIALPGPIDSALNVSIDDPVINNTPTITLTPTDASDHVTSPTISSNNKNNNKSKKDIKKPKKGKEEIS